MKKFAKLMSVVLAIAMLFAMAIPVASVAAEGEKLAIVVETVEANAGDQEVQVKVFVPAEPHWSAIDLTFNFDPAKLSYFEFVPNAALQQQMTGGKPNVYALNDEKANEGEVIVALASAIKDGDNDYEGYHNVDRRGNAYDYLGTFSFDVAEGATGLQEITVTVGKLVNSDSENVEYEITNGGIKLPGGEEPPVEPTTPVVSGVTEGQEFDLSKDEKPAPTWEPAEATATLNNEPYTAGTEIGEAGDYTLVVTNGDKTATVNFKVVEGGEEPPQPGEGLDIVVETVEANAGDQEVQVKVFVPAEPHWSAIDLTFNFDPAKLSYFEFVPNAALQQQMTGGKPNVYALNDEKANEGEVIVALASAIKDGDNDYEGYHNVDRRGNVYDYLGTFSFDVAQDAEDGLHAITVTVGKLVNSDSENVEYRVTNGGIKLGEDACEHDWVETERVAATCTEPGKIVYQCSKCEETKEETIDIDPEAHNWVEIGRTKATCAAEGVINYACSNNPEHLKDEPIAIDPDAHDWGEWVDSDKEGWEQRICKNDPSHIEEREKTPVEPTTPVVSGVTEGQEFDLNKGEKPAPTWEPAEATATLNGEPYTAGTEIGETGDYTLVVTNGDKTTTVNFKVVDNSSTEPEEPTAPAVTGITDGQEFDLGKGEKPAPTWEPADATATLNGKPYTAGTAIDKAGDYTLVVTNGDKTTTIKFTVKDSTATNPDQPNTSDLPVAGIAIVALIASAAVVVIARKKRFAR